MRAMSGVGALGRRVATAAVTAMVVVPLVAGCGRSEDRSQRTPPADSAASGRISFDAATLPSGFTWASAAGVDGRETAPVDGLAGASVMGTATGPAGERFVALTGWRDVLEQWASPSEDAETTRSEGHETTTGLADGSLRVLTCAVVDERHGDDRCALLIAAESSDRPLAASVAASLVEGKATLDGEQDASALLASTPSRTLVARGDGDRAVWVTVARGRLPVALRDAPGVTVGRTAAGQELLRWTMGGSPFAVYQSGEHVVMSVSTTLGVDADEVAAVGQAVRGI